MSLYYVQKALYQLNREIRTFIAVAGAAEGSSGEIWCYQPIPIFAVGCTVGVMNLARR